jgi:hypothetical protein
MVQKTRSRRAKQAHHAAPIANVGARGHSLRSSLYAEDPIRYDPVSQQVIESRLQKYVGNDKQREDTLRQMFSQAGCDDQHLSQQPVKGSKLSNLICVLPRSTNQS